MDKKLILSFCLLGSLVSSCGDYRKANVSEAELNQEAVLLNCRLNRQPSSLYVWMGFDTDGDYSKPEYVGFSVFEVNAISESAVDQYQYEFSQLQIGAKGTLKEWQKLIRNIGRIKD